MLFGFALKKKKKQIALVATGAICSCRSLFNERFTLYERAFHSFQEWALLLFEEQTESFYDTFLLRSICQKLAIRTKNQRATVIPSPAKLLRTPNLNIFFKMLLINLVQGLRKC